VVKSGEEMTSVELHRSAILVALSVLILIAVGSYVGSRAGAPQPAARGPLDASVHTVVAVAVGILALGEAVIQSLAKEGAFLGWTAMGFLVGTAWVGWLGISLLHAGLAAVTFAILVAIGVLTSASWNEGAEFVSGQAAPMLRPVAIAGPPLVLLQILLGAAYRHKLTGVTPHLGGAMVVAFATLVPAMLVKQQYPEHRALRSSATWLMSIVLVQVTLGATAFAMQLLDVESPAALVTATALHAVVGCVTLAASLVMAMQVQRNVRRARAGVPAKAS
jgi:heme A synthase